jgi:release factor glutamine methyltransferase
VDVNPAACHWARVNAEVARPGAVDVREADLAAALDADEMFPLIIADPPWVASADVTAFPEDPRIAIDGGADGLALARLCLDVTDGHLATGGAALLQLGDAAQVGAVGAHLVSIGSTLMVGEVREFDRGVLALIRRRSAC